MIWIILNNATKNHHLLSGFIKKSLNENQKNIVIEFKPEVIDSAGKFNFKKLLISPKVFLLIKVILTNKNVSIIGTSPSVSSLFVFLIHTIMNYKNSRIYFMHEPILPNNSIYNLMLNLFNRIYNFLSNKIIFFSLTAEQRYLNKYSPIKNYYRMKYPSGYKNLNQINFNIREYYSFIGNIRKNKNLSLFISLVESFPNKKFLIAGSGDLGESKHRINNLENLDIINRFLSDEEYKLLIKKSLYVFLPYKYTTQSAIVIDSFMYGVPVISSKEGLFNEIINNGHNSYSFEITNYVKNAFEVIKNFDLKHYKIICKNCLEYYNNNHTFEIFQSKIKKIVNNESS